MKDHAQEMGQNQGWILDQGTWEGPCFVLVTFL